MLTFKKIIINNFGPYRENQTIKFPEDDGVTIVWGDNGTGKTTLMNAIRFVLWGKLDNENNRNIVSYINKDASDDEGMSIELHMDYDGITYIITRSLNKKANTDGIHNGDYTSEVFLKKGQSVLSPNECTHVLQTILPEEISRFYLFDGELLQQYENLIMEHSDNEIIKKSIENILGLPFLENSRDCLSIISQEYERNYTKLAANHERTKNDASKITSFTEKIDRLNNTKNDFIKDKDEVKSKLLNIEKTLEQTGDYRVLKEKIDNYDKRIGEITAEINDLKENIKSQIDNLWEFQIHKLISQRIKQNEAKINSLEIERTNYFRNKYILDLFSNLEKNNNEDKICPICNSKISVQDITNIRERLSSFISNYNDITLVEYDNLSNEIKTLKNFELKSRPENIIESLNKLNELNIKLHLEQNERTKAKQEISKFPQTSIYLNFKELLKEQEFLIKRIDNYENGIREIDKEIVEYRESINRLKANIRSNSNDIELLKAEAIQEKCSSLLDVFETAINLFKVKLKDRVQKDATNYFQSISHNPDYKELVINDQYGLEIYTSKGERVPNRSAGYVQVVAISLIAALHKNTPISGPIIMDSTFQRIDQQHKKNILESLPKLGHQVVVLAYPGEIDAQISRDTLKGKLRKEISLVQESPFNTIIK